MSWKEVTHTSKKMLRVQVKLAKIWMPRNLRDPTRSPGPLPSHWRGAWTCLGSPEVYNEFSFRLLSEHQLDKFSTSARDGNREPVPLEDRFPVVQILGIVSLPAYRSRLSILVFSLWLANFSSCVRRGDILVHFRAYGHYFYFYRRKDENAMVKWGVG